MPAGFPGDFRMVTIDIGQVARAPTRAILDNRYVSACRGDHRLELITDLERAAGADIVDLSGTSPLGQRKIRFGGVANVEEIAPGG